jgi:hypothetical protein
MKTMKRRTAIAVTMGVWIAALGSAAALTYELNSPLRLMSTSSLPTERVRTAPAPLASPVPEMQAVLYIPSMTVVGYAPHRRPALVPEPGGSAISEVHCSEWRELDMGSGHVQVCD